MIRVKKGLAGLCRLAMVISIIAMAQAAYTQPLQAAWISRMDTAGGACTVFHKQFSSKTNIKSAKLSVTAHGLYEACVNGKRVGKAYFTPGWTNYDKRLQYQEYDVTKLIKEQNSMQVTVADGWYRGAFGGDLQKSRYGRDVSVLVQLCIRYADGTSEQVVSDSSWRCATGPIRSSDIYNGEMIDDNFQPAYAPVVVNDYAKVNLVPTISEPVIKQDTFKPVAIQGNIVDFGQNLAGFVQIRVKGRRGDTIKVSHAEALDKDGRLFTGNLRDAQATDMYILNGQEQVLEPHFTYHGFRYAKVEGFIPTKNNCTAIALYSDLKRTGTFRCSNPMLNQLQSNINWSLNSNFVDIPTDCPQRSERLGWTGDAQVFCATAAFNCNVKLFFTKWLEDLKADQGVNGAVPSIIPDLYRHADSLKTGRAGWGDAATIIPWTLFEVYGDTLMLQGQYESMKSWVNYIASVSKNDLWKDFTYGDWYAPGDSTSIALIDQCFFAYSTQLLINAATILGKTGDVAFYTDLLRKIKKALLEKYFDAGGKAVTHTQTAYILPLQFDLLPENLAKKAITHLVDLIHANNDHLATGFLGTPYLLPVLTKYGYTDLAYTILNQTTPPSWLYPVTKGATTIWEKWEAIRPDGSFDTCSLNHYAYGAVGDWLYTVVAGIDALEPGFKKIKIAPEPGGGLTWVKASYQSGYGNIVSEWKIRSRYLTMKVTIPPNTTAEIHIPDGKIVNAGAGTYHYKIRYGAK